MNMSEAIYDELKSSLLAGRLNLPELIQESNVAEQFGVSKTPAREALNRLVDQGILVKYSRKGYVLKKLSDKQFIDLQILRCRVLCSFADDMISKNTDEELSEFSRLVTDYGSYEQERIGLNSYFYIKLAELTKNEWVVSVTELLLMYFFGCSHPVYQFHSTAIDDTKAGHHRIIKALLARDAQALRAALESDIIR